MLAAAGILDQFTDFLIMLGVAFPPIAGIMVAEYFVVKRWRGRARREPRADGPLPATAPPGAGDARHLARSPRWSASTSSWGIPSLNSLRRWPSSLYVVAGKLGLVRGIGAARPGPSGPQPEPVQPDRRAGDERTMRIGIDVGGTNTDAVLMDGTQRARRGQDAHHRGRHHRHRRPRSTRLRAEQPAFDAGRASAR